MAISNVKVPTRTYLRHMAKGVALSSLMLTGLPLSRAMRRLDGRILILTYHRVLPAHGRDTFSAPGIIVTPDTFSWQLRQIRRHMTPLHPSEFLDILSKRCPVPRRACLVTFDDGWYDNFVHAMPIVEQHRVPVLLFAATGFIGTTACFWQERLTRELYVAWRQGPRGQAALRVVAADVPAVLSPQLARTRIRDAVTSLKRLSPTQLSHVFDLVKSALGANRVSPPETNGDDRFLSWEEIAAMASSSLVTVGSHAASHVPLPALDPASQIAELENSRSALSRRLEKPVDWFAYPNGDFDEDSARRVEQVGYTGAFTTQTGLTSPGDDFFRLRRINVHEHATDSFSRVLHLLSTVPR